MWDIGPISGGGGYGGGRQERNFQNTPTVRTGFSKRLLTATTLMQTNPAALARLERGHGAKAEFLSKTPFPAMGANRGGCKGYVIDHIKPLACGDADAPSNIQWQTVAEGKAIYKWERRVCEHKATCVRGGRSR